MKIAVTYSLPSQPVIEGHVIGASPVELGTLVMQLADGEIIMADADFINEK